MANSKTRIVKAAIARLGEEVPQSINEDVDALIAQDAMYESLVEEQLTSRTGWRFATRWRALEANNNTPPKPWVSEYPTPSEMLGVQDVIDEYGNGVDYELAENNLIYTRREADVPLTLIYTYWPAEERWPGDFAGAVEEELYGRLLGAFDEMIRAGEIREIAEKKFARAFRRQLRQKPPQRINTSPLLRAWFGRATGRH